MSTTNSRKSAPYRKTGKNRPPARRGLPAAAALGLLLGLAGCGPLAPGAGGTQVMTLAGGSLRLAAPRGFCIDARSSSASAQGGFALLVPCGRGWQLGRKGAVLTAAAGPAAADATAPDAEDIAAMFARAEVLERREDGPLPLVRLKYPGHTAKGASPVHWRGAFVIEGHLVALALYAPAGSPALGPRGARLLEELTTATLAASTEPEAQDKAPSAPEAGAKTSEQAASALPVQTAWLLRPRANPLRQTAPVTGATGFGTRIANWFR